MAETLLALGLDEVVERELRLRRRRRGLGEFDKLQAIVLLLAAGGERAEEIRVLREDKALSRLLERSFRRKLRRLGSLSPGIPCLHPIRTAREPHVRTARRRC